MTMFWLGDPVELSMLDLLPDPVIGLDNDRRVVSWNLAAERVYGYTRAEALGAHKRDLLRTGFLTPPAGSLETLSQTGEWRGELVHHSKDGRALAVEERWRACFDAEGRPMGTLTVDRELESFPDAGGERFARALPQEECEEAAEATVTVAQGSSRQVLIVDDEPHLRAWTQRTLERQGYSCASAPDAQGAREKLSEGSFELALLDVNLPDESGIALLRHLRVEHPDVAALMVTGEDDLSLASTAIELGAYGYMVKPVRAGELVINVVNVLHRRRREEQLRRRVERLQGSTERRQLGAMRGAIAAAELEPIVEAYQGEAIRRLVRLAEVRDDETGKHMIRMGRYCELIALQLGLSETWAEQLGLASELHDIGKVAIPDSILLKPGRLTAQEFEVMKTHAEVGHELLSDADTEVMQLAANVALTHHERWDGGGYPHGLCGEAIPVEGRIAAVADVFDALTSDRVYRPAMPVAIAVDMMEQARDAQFDPTMLDAMRGAFEKIERVRTTQAG